MMLKLGGKNVLIVNPRDMPGFVKELKEVRVEGAGAVGLDEPLLAGLAFAGGFLG